MSGRVLLALERHRELLSIIEQRGSARVSELARRFDVTEETIRRDLDKLEANGKLARSHGGAVAIYGKEASHVQRAILNAHEKEAIAKEACKRVREEDVLLLDASSTAWFLAQQLPDIPLTVVTNSLPVAQALTGRRHFKIVCAGGTLTESSMSFVGPEALDLLQRCHAQKLFMSCRGVDVQRGASDLSEEQARIRRTMLQISDKRFLLVDSSKFDTRALAVIAPLNAFTQIITDASADPEYCAAIEGQGVSVIRAPA